MKNDENGAAMKKKVGCHKKSKNRTANKKWPKRPITRLKKAQKLGQKEAKKKGRLGQTRAVQKRRKGKVKESNNGAAMKKR